MLKILRRMPEIVLGTVAVLLAVVLVPTVHARMTAGSQERVCRDHLRVIYQAIQRYRADHHGEYPTSFVPPPRVFGAHLRDSALVPRYLKDASVLVCPLDPSGGAKLGWSQPFTYEYGLEELMSPSPEVRQRMKTGVIDRFGPKMYLAICPSSHRHGPMGFLTLHADGRIYKELILADDPQQKFRRSLWELEAATAPKPPAKGPATGELPVPRRAAPSSEESPR
jgi:hypothetical protein